MAELGALSLRIEATGQREVLGALDAIDAKATRTGSKPLEFKVSKKELDALNRSIDASVQQYQLFARTVDAGSKQAVASMRQLQQEQLAYLQSAGASETQLLRFAAAVQSFEKRVAAAGVAEKVAATEGIAAIERRIALFSKGATITATRADAVRRLITIETALTSTLARGNATVEQRIILNNALQRTQAGIASGIEQTTQVAQRSAAVQRTQAQGFTILGQAATTSAGRLSAFSTRGIGALNAASFALSGLASGGQVSFRSLSSAAAGFAAFFGPGGAIASIGITAGLAMTDFFTRTRREIEETRKKATEELGKLEGQREAARRSRDPAGLETQIADDTEELAEKRIQLAAIEHRTAEARTEQEKALLPVLKERIAVLEREIQLNTQARFTLRQARPTGELPGRTTEVKKPPTAEDAQKAIAAEIAALASLSQARGLSGIEVVRLSQLERQLTAELLNSHPTKEREAEIWDQITKARQAAARVLPAATVRDITPTRAPTGRPTLIGGTGVRDTGAATRLEQPNIKLPSDEQKNDVFQRTQQRFDESEAAKLEQSLADSLGSALAAGIAGGFAQGLGEGGIGEGFKQMAAQLATGLGSMAIDYGLKAIAISKLMTGISAFLIRNPVLAIAGGVALVALGRSMGGSGGGGRAGAGGGFGGGGGSAGGSDVLQGYVFGENAFSSLNTIPERLRDTVRYLRDATVPTAPTWGQSMRPLVINTPEGQRELYANSNAHRLRGG